MISLPLVPRRFTFAALLALSAAGCGGGSGSEDDALDAGRDAGPDGGGVDSGLDAGADAGDAGDAGADAETDAGDAAPPGPCPGLDPEVDIDENGVPDCEETLVQNAQFAIDASGWVAPNGGSHERVGDDAQGNEASGSLEVQNEVVADLVGYTAQHSTQCVPVTPNESYEVFAHVFIPGGQDPAAAARLSAFFYPSSNCLGGLLGTNASSGVRETDQWVRVSNGFTVPSMANYVALGLTVEKHFDADPVAVRFDDVLLRPAP